MTSKLANRNVTYLVVLLAVLALFATACATKGPATPTDAAGSAPRHVAAGPSATAPQAPQRPAPAEAALKNRHGDNAADTKHGTNDAQTDAVRDGQRGASQREMLKQRRLMVTEQRAAAKRLIEKRRARIKQLLLDGKITDLVGAPPRLPAGLAGAAAVDGCPTCGMPGGIPDYFGTTPNWGYSPLPKGALGSISVTSGGSGYIVPVVLIEDLYGNGTGAVANATVVDGVVTDIAITNPGTNYVAPIVTITDPEGTGATAEAVLDEATLTGGLRKFINTLPGLNAPNDLGELIPVAVPDVVTYPGSDYYEIEILEYTAQMHGDLPNRTRLRGYAQVNNGTDTSACGNAGQPACSVTDNTLAPPRGPNGEAEPHYLGPIIVASKDRPVRLKVTNKVPAGEAGKLFIPVDTSIMGAGVGPDSTTMYSQNRAAIHLHGGRTPWISDGTAHQWFTPAGETTGNGDVRFQRGESFQNVPDMPDPGPGAQTIYFTNQQSSRLLFYHDHSSGITRLNVYVGEAAGYLLMDDVERQLIADGTIPAEEIPLVIQTKTFVDANTLPKTDPTWNWGTAPLVNGVRAPKTGDLWWPHVYMTAENPYDMSGVNAVGRWVYGPWFWPPTPVCSPDFPPPACVVTGPIPNPLYQVACEQPNNPECTRPGQPPEIPGTPLPSWAAEAFLDTPMVNGTAYPTVTLDPKPYRFRILNADNDRMFNLQLYIADPGVVTGDGRHNTEVRMVPASMSSALPANWPADGRAGGVPDPSMVGPDWLVIGNEGGFLPTPARLETQPVVWNMDPTTFNFGNVESGSLKLAPAERSDVIVDFSAYAGQTLILYNDAPAPWPALDPHYDYYTGCADNTSIGGAPAIYAGYGPNTRTIMQIKVADAAPASFNPAPLEAAFKAQPGAPSVFERGQDPVIVGQTAYNATYGVTFPNRWPYWGVARIHDTGLGFQTVTEAKARTWPPRNRTLAMQPKAIHDEMGGVFDPYGRLSARLGIEIFGANAQTQNFVMQAYADPTTEIMNPSAIGVQIGAAGDGTQIWKVTHNGVDTHPIHFHLMDVQLINRVGWDGFMRLPDADELGWKETVRFNPLEDTIVALRPVIPQVPFGLPLSRRHLNPALPEGSEEGFTGLDPLTGDALPTPTTNQLADFGWEYTWHCHILAHEENDMMRPISFMVTPTAPAAPSGLTVTRHENDITIADLSWVDATPGDAAASLGDLSGEIGFRIERSNDNGRHYTEIGTALANATKFTETAAPAPPWPVRYRVRAYNAAGDAVSSAAPLVNYPAPTITSIDPTAGALAGGTVVTINGTGFIDGVTATIGGANAPVTFVSSTKVTATTAAHAAGAVDIVVTNPDDKTGTLAGGYTYQPAPNPTAVVPNTGATAGGNLVTINGTNFTAQPSVTFGGVAAASTFVNATTITATAPAHASGAVSVVVTAKDGQVGTLPAGYTYEIPPTVTAVAPSHGPSSGGTSVTVTGTNFKPGAVAVFGGIPAATNFVSATSVTAVAAAHSPGIVDVAVNNPSGLFGLLPGSYTYDPPPSVTSINPNNGPAAGGTTVTITGANFRSGAGVTIGGTPATNVSVTNATTISARTAAHAGGAYDVVVTNPDGQTGTLPAGYSYNPPPTVTAVKPSAGPPSGRTSVTITGTDFRAGATVTFGPTPATNVVVVSPTQITALNPARAAGTVDVVVTNTDGQRGTLAGGYTYTDVDMTISSLTVPAGVDINVGFIVTDTVRLSGNNGAPANTTSLYLSRTTTLDGTAIPIGSRAVPAVAARGTNRGSSTATIPAGTAAGSYYVIAKADGPDQILESSETNNTSSQPVTVGPDLQISSLRAPNRANAGTTISVTDTTQDGGAGAAGPSRTNFYLSTATTRQPGDVLLGGRDVPALAGYANDTRTTPNLLIPAGTAAGRYYILAVANDTTVVSEYNANNNTRSSAITIN